MIDLFTHLQAEYNKHLVEGQEEGCEKHATLIAMDSVREDGINKFIAFCKESMKNNPPSSVFMATRGIGLKLADGTEVCTAEEPAEDEPIIPESIPITRPRSTPGKHGISDTRSIPVFGGGK